MNLPRAIIISGPPATGKSAIADAIEKELRWPVVSKDRIKEHLFDERGVQDRAWSKRLGIEAFEILEKRIERLLLVKCPFIIEGNFKRATTTWINNAIIAHHYYPIHIFCNAPDVVIVSRIKERWENKHRHPGHADDQTLVELKNGNSWDEERRASFGEKTLKLTEQQSLPENIKSALDFVRKNL